MTRAPLKSSSGVVAIRIKGVRPPLWIGFTLTPRGLARVVVEPSRAKALRALGASACNAPAARSLAKRFQAYARGDRRALARLKIDLSGLPPFRARVLRLTQTIPFGKVTTYGSLAKALKRPKAARAVGQALALNPIPLVIPCHRVLGRSGKLTGFSMFGGTALKRALLAHESPPRPRPQE
jgi:methylated-DNA-[protein]-cysteine S-methyltransferase